MESALQRGHGRAFLYAARHGIPGGLLVHALTHNLRFDTQCEDAAQDWYLAMASRHQAAPTIFANVIRRAVDANDSDHKHYIAGTLALLHRDGHPEALPALYKLSSNFDRNDSPPFPGASELVEIEGEMGLVHALRTLASTLPDGLIEPWMVRQYFYQYTDSSKECIEKLAALAASDNTFKPLLDIMLRTRPSRWIQKDGEPRTADLTLSSLARLSKEQLQETPASVVIDLVRQAPQDAIGAAMRRWAMLASQDALDEILSEALAEDDPHRTQMYLRAFTERSPLHRFDERFACWIDHPMDSLRRAAHFALATCPDPRVRELALQRLAPQQIASGSICMLQSTYQPGDHRAVESALYVPDDLGTLHDIGFFLLDVFGKNATHDCLGSMLYVYEHGPCMNCRERAIGIMHAAGVLPDWVREESRFDADSQIRKQVSGSEAIPPSMD